MRKGKALLGFMSWPEALSFFQADCAIGDTPEPELKAQWERSTKVIEELPHFEQRELEVEEVPDNCREQLEVVANTPLFKSAMAQKPYSFKLVPIDELIAFQKYVDVTYAGDITKEVKSPEDIAAAINISLPPKIEERFEIQFDQQTMSATITSFRRNLFITGFSAGQADPAQAPSVSFLIGAGANYVQVVKLRGRYFLKNGYHRVYSLRAIGFETVPCALIEGADFGDTGAARPGFFPEDLLFSAKPPLFNYFFVDGLAAEVTLKPKMKIIRIRAEDFLVPYTE